MDEEKQKQTDQTPHQELLRKILRQIQTNVQAALDLIGDGDPILAEKLLTAPAAAPESRPSDRVVEGIFDGQKMVGENGESYGVPANYASKSKLVAGDRMKLIITGSGKFLFKQIGPVERGRRVGTLALDGETHQYVVVSEDARWKVLTASVTYFHGAPGDEAVVLTPKYASSSWAAVENIVKRS